jgi:hypothetical protein
LNTFASIKNNSTMNERDFQAMQSVVWAKGELRPEAHTPTQPKLAMSAEEVIAYFKGQIANNGPWPYSPSDYGAIVDYCERACDFYIEKRKAMMVAKLANQDEDWAAQNEWLKSRHSFYVRVLAWAQNGLSDCCQDIFERFALNSVDGMDMTDRRPKFPLFSPDQRERPKP